jgi:hypothetical protein
VEVTSTYVTVAVSLSVILSAEANVRLHMAGSNQNSAQNGDSSDASGRDVQPQSLRAVEGDIGSVFKGSISSVNLPSNLDTTNLTPPPPPPPPPAAD